jgi:glycosyltransferase involved in cell wall biosynthesis
MAELRMHRPKVLIVLNKAWNLYNFRAGLIRALDQAGYEVVAAAPEDEYASRLPALGCRFVALPQSNHGTSVLGELALIVRFWRLLRRERPDFYLGFTVKPNTYGSALAGLMGIRVINNIAGLGTAFIRGGWLGRVVQALYRFSLQRSAKVFFQNSTDRDLFLTRGLVRAGQVGLLPGSGVDLQRFAASAMPDAGGAGESAPVRFLLVARLLLDKGVLEYVQAARTVRAAYPQARFQLLGFLDEANPRGVRRAELAQWVSEGVVEYLGTTDDVRPYLAQAHCVVLPSYREGTSRALLEAAAMARPLIATDVPGCREVVDDGVTGYLCQVKSSVSLAEQVMRFLALSPVEKAGMGQAGRAKMEREFGEGVVTTAYLAELARLQLKQGE